MAAGILGPGALNAQVSLQQARESQLLQQMQLAKGPDQKQKIEKGAKEFEALLLSGWLQQAEQSMATVPGADDDGDDAGQNTMTSLGVQTLATSLADSGGIGIGAMIAKAMLAMAQKEEAANGQAPPSPEIPPKSEALGLNSSLENADRMGVSRKVPK